MVSPLSLKHLSPQVALDLQHHSRSRATPELRLRRVDVLLPTASLRQCVTPHPCPLIYPKELEPLFVGFLLAAKLLKHLYNESTPQGALDYFRQRRGGRYP